MLPDDTHEFVKFPLKRCFVKINALQLAHEFSDVLMGEAAVSHELRPVLAGHRLIRRVEDVFFQLRVQIKLGKDLRSKQMLGAKAISRKEITVLESACSDEPLGMCSPSAFERSYHVHARLDACLPTVA
jgi:hypothetical protein